MFSYIPFSLEGKESACTVGDVGLVPGLGRSPGQGNGNPLQYSCLENPVDKGALHSRDHKCWTRHSNETTTTIVSAVAKTGLQTQGMG